MVLSCGSIVGVADIFAGCSSVGQHDYKLLDFFDLACNVLQLTDTSIGQVILVVITFVVLIHCLVTFLYELFLLTRWSLLGGEGFGFFVSQHLCVCGSESEIYPAA